MYSTVSMKPKMLRKQLALGAATAGVIGLMAAGAPGWAQTTDSGSVDVVATALTTCTVTTEEINFGNYAGTEITVPPTVTGTGYLFAALECTVGFVEAVFCLSEGQYFDGTTRRMRNTATPASTSSDDNISYELYFEGTGLTTKLGETPHPADPTSLNCDGGGTVHPGLENYFDPATNATEWQIRTEGKTLGGGTTPGAYSDTLTATFVFQ